MPTKQEIAATLQVVKAAADAVKELGSVPSGHLYASLMSTGMSLDSYNAIIGTLKRAGLVKETAFELTWIGPK